MTRIFISIYAGQSISVPTLLLDVLCINPKYVLGWYLQYLLVCYLIFCVYWFLRQKNKTVALLGLLAVSIISFFISPTELQAEQSLSFITGVFLSENRKTNIIRKFVRKPLMGGLIFIVIGMVAFLTKQLFGLQSTLCIYGLQLIYKYSWAIMLVLVSTLFVQRYRLNIVAIFGKYSYEIYLTHGYLFGFLRSFVKIPAFFGIEFLLTALLNKTLAIMKKGVSRISLKNGG